MVIKPENALLDQLQLLPRRVLNPWLLAFEQDLGLKPEQEEDQKAVLLLYLLALRGLGQFAVRFNGI